MKAVLEFGVRGGAHTDNLIIPSAKLAAKLAVNLIYVLSSEQCSEWCYIPRRNHPRILWSNSSHFVCVSLLDGIERGPASPSIWRTNT